MTGPGFEAYGLDGDFTAAFLAARRVADLAERDPAAVSPAAVCALETLLVRNAHDRQTQSRILYRDAAGVLATLLARGPQPLARASRDALVRVLSIPGKPRIAAAEAVGALPLPGLRGPYVALPSPAAVPTTFAALLARAGADPDAAPRPAGRSLLVAAREPDRVVVVKRLRRDEDATGLVREAVWMEYCAGLAFPAPCHVPAPCRQGDAALWAVPDAPWPSSALDPEGRCLAYVARRDYFAYPNAPRHEGGPDADGFAEVMARSALLLGWLAGQGILHEAAIPLFHNRVQRDRRGDGGVYDWRLPGRLDRWLASSFHPNFGLSGLRDFEHLAASNGRGTRFYRTIGDHFVSLFLVAGSYFRMRDPGLVGRLPDGSPADARHLFDEDVLARVLERIVAAYHQGFVGAPAGTPLFDARHLARRMTEEMGVDRYMTELVRVEDQQAMTDKEFVAFLEARGMPAAQARSLRRAEADVALETGPHLGDFNNRTSLLELNGATAAAVAACLAARHDRERWEETRRPRVRPAEHFGGDRGESFPPAGSGAAPRA